jgi:hypothetical protein
VRKLIAEQEPITSDGQVAYIQVELERLLEKNRTLDRY